MSEAESETLFLNANQVRKRYGGCSHMALIRWMASEGFPQPTYFGRKRFWRLTELESWERDRTARSKQSRPPTGFQRSGANAAKAPPTAPDMKRTG